MCTNLCVKNVTNNSTFLQILYIRSERAQEWFWKKLNFKSSPLICYLCPCPVYPQPFTPFPNYLLENRTQLLRRHPSKEGLSLSHILRSLSGAHAFCLGAQKISVTLQIPVEFPLAPHSDLTWRCLKQESFPSQADPGTPQTGPWRPLSSLL